MIRFASWYYLFLIPLIIYIFFFHLERKKAALKFSSVKLLLDSGMKKTFKHKIGRYIIAVSLILLSVAMARPQTLDKASPAGQKGIDIAMILDVSGSMQSVDFQPNRLEVAKDTIGDFIAQRPQDRICFIIFAGTAYTRIPLTLDHNIVRESLEEVSSESVNADGTAVGMAISVGINRLKNSDAASKIIILVTDGDNNAGAINPVTAAELAREMGIKVYTIGVGTDQTIIPVRGIGGVRYQQMSGGLNEKLLQDIADRTGGQYYRARDPKALSQIFDNINRLEKTQFQQDAFTEYNELAYPLIKAALILMIAGLFLDRYLFVRIP